MQLSPQCIVYVSNQQWLWSTQRTYSTIRHSLTLTVLCVLPVIYCDHRFCVDRSRWWVACMHRNCILLDIVVWCTILFDWLYLYILLFNYWSTSICQLLLFNESVVNLGIHVHCINFKFKYKYKEIRETECEPMVGADWHLIL